MEAPLNRIHLNDHSLGFYSQTKTWNHVYWREILLRIKYWKVLKCLLWSCTKSKIFADTKLINCFHLHRIFNIRKDNTKTVSQKECAHLHNSNTFSNVCIKYVLLFSYQLKWSQTLIISYFWDNLSNRLRKTVNIAILTTAISRWTLQWFYFFFFFVKSEKRTHQAVNKFNSLRRITC